MAPDRVMRELPHNTRMIDTSRGRVLPASDWSGRLNRDLANDVEASAGARRAEAAARDRMMGDDNDVGECGFRADVYRWRNQFGGLKSHDAKRLKDVERLHRIVQQQSPVRTPQHQHLLATLAQARVVISDCKDDYNHGLRRHALGDQPPAVYAVACTIVDRLSPDVDQFSVRPERMLGCELKPIDDRWAA